MDEAYINLKNAISKNEFHAFLMGKGSYALADRWIEVPTDITRVFISGCNGFVGQSSRNAEGLKSAFHDAFNEMLKEPVGTWWTISILYSYLFGYKENALLFSIDVHRLIPQINNSLMAFRETLKSSKEYVGWRFPDGLWGDVVVMAAKINEHLKDSDIRIILT